MSRLALAIGAQTRNKISQAFGCILAGPDFTSTTVAGLEIMRGARVATMGPTT